MKCNSRHALIFFIGAAHLAAADPQPVVIDYRVYIAPQEHAFPLIQELQSTGANDAVRSLDKLAAAGHVRLAAITKLHTVNGAQARQSASEDQRYPIEWAQPVELGRFGPRLLDGATAADFAMPTTIETREIGARIEVTAELNPDAQQATVLVDAGIAHLDGWFRAPASFTTGTVAMSFPQPRFANSRIATRLTIPLRHWMLFSAQTDAKKPGLMILHTIRATAPDTKLAPIDRKP